MLVKEAAGHGTPLTVGGEDTTPSCPPEAGATKRDVLQRGGWVTPQEQGQLFSLTECDVLQQEEWLPLQELKDCASELLVSSSFLMYNRHRQVQQAFPQTKGNQQFLSV